MTPGTRSRAIGAAVAVIAVALDQLSKTWILESVMNPPRIIEITPFFNIVLAWNRGVSFGMFNDHGESGPLILTALAVAIVIALSVWLWRATTMFSVVALGLVIGGAVGNVVDRMIHGAVVDFLDFHVLGYHWPAFNVADSAICVGAAILILESLFTRAETS